MNDVAFAFMDLLAWGWPELAWRFVNGYVERTGDFDGLLGLRAFAAYRALVRAKVALLSGQPQGFLRYRPRWPRLWQPSRPAPPAAGDGAEQGRQVDAGGQCRRAAGGDAAALGRRAQAHPWPGSDRPRRVGAASLRAGRHLATYDRLRELAPVCWRRGILVVVDAALLRQSENALRCASWRRRWTCLSVARNAWRP